MGGTLGVAPKVMAQYITDETAGEIADAIRGKSNMTSSQKIYGSDFAWTISKLITTGDYCTNCKIDYGKITPSSNVALNGYSINHNLGELPRAFFVFFDEVYNISATPAVSDIVIAKVSGDASYFVSGTTVTSTTSKTFQSITVTPTVSTSSVSFTTSNNAYFASEKNYYWVAVGSNNDTQYDPSHVTYTLSFDTDGGSAVSPVTVNAGTTVQLSGYTSSKDGYTFDGWSDTSAREDLISSILMDSNKTVYAKFTEQGGGDPEVIELSGIKLGSTSLQSKAASIKTYIAAVEAGTKYYINWDKGTLGTGAYIAYNSTGGTTAGTEVSGYTMIGTNLANKEYTVPAGATHIYLYNNNGGAQTVFTVTKNPL